MNMTNQISLQSLWIEHTYTFATLICVLSDDDRVSSSLVDLFMCFSDVLLLFLLLLGFLFKKKPRFPGIVCKNQHPFNLFWTHIFILIFLLHVLISLPTFCFANLNSSSYPMSPTCSV